MYKTKKILLAHSNHGDEMIKWHNRRELTAKRLGYDFTTFNMTGHFPYTIFPKLDKMWKKKDSELLTPLLKIEDNKEPYNTARQELPEVWAQTGAIEVIRAKTIIASESMSGLSIAGVEVSEDTYIDIDTLNSLLMAEVMLSKLSCIKPI